jgi:predicted ester cyclase
MSTGQDHKRLILRLHDVWNTGNLDDVETVYAPDFVAHFPPSSEFPERRGLDWVRRGILRIREAFPDWHEEVADLIAEGDRVVSRYISRGTHQGTFWQIPPTGRRVEVGEISIFRVAGGKVLEQWCSIDELGRLQQLGAIPNPWSHKSASRCG